MPAVLILIYLFIEVMATSWFSSTYGGGMLFVEFLTTGIIGVVMISSTGTHMRDSLMRLKRGEIDPRDLMSSTISRIVGGVLLFIPGIISDIIGIILQFNLTRFSKKDINKEYSQNAYGENNENDDIIDVEVIDREVKN